MSIGSIRLQSSKIADSFHVNSVPISRLFIFVVTMWGYGRTPRYSTPGRPAIASAKGSAFYLWAHFGLIPGRTHPQIRTKLAYREKGTPAS
jgi:hypothetical protein